MKKLKFSCNDQTKITPEGPVYAPGYWQCDSEKEFIRGSWYGELTHLNGTNGHFFGFSTNCGYILFYPEKNIESPRIYSGGCFLVDGTIRTMLDFQIKSDHTVGILINIDEHTFSVFYENRFYIHKYQQMPKDTVYRVRFGGGWISTEDFIMLNFGNEKFKYQVPSMPMNFVPKPKSCNNYFHQKYRFFFCFILFF